MFTEVSTLDAACDVAKEMLKDGYIVTITGLPNGDYRVNGTK